MRRSVLLVSVLALIVGAVPACSDKTNGSAVPGSPTSEQTGSSTTTTGRGTSTTRPTTGNSPLAGKDPCSLLTANAQSQLGISNGAKHDVGTNRGCQWRQRAGTGDLYLYGVDINDKAGIKDLPSDLEIKKLPNIGKHEAIQNPAKQGGACSVIMGVTDSSRVGATVVAGVDVQKGCELALQMAKLVEPELP